MKKCSITTYSVWVLVICLASTVVCMAGPGASGAATPAAASAPFVAEDTAFPYHGPIFTGFVEDSYRVGGSGEAAEFYRWMEQAYTAAKVRPTGTDGLTLEETLERERLDLAGQPTRRGRRRRNWS